MRFLPGSPVLSFGTSVPNRADPDNTVRPAQGRRCSLRYGRTASCARVPCYFNPKALSRQAIIFGDPQSPFGLVLVSPNWPVSGSGVVSL